MNNKYIPVITRKESYKLAVDDICYIYRSNRKLMYETNSGLIHSYDKIDDIEKYLGPEFYRCTSGCIVNLSRIENIKDLTILFDDGKTYKPGKETYLKVKRRYNAFLVNLLLQEQFESEDDSDE